MSNGLETASSNWNTKLNFTWWLLQFRLRYQLSVCSNYQNLCDSNNTRKRRSIEYSPTTHLLWSKKMEEESRYLLNTVWFHEKFNCFALDIFVVPRFCHRNSVKSNQLFLLNNWFDEKMQFFYTNLSGRFDLSFERKNLKLAGIQTSQMSPFSKTTKWYKHHIKHVRTDLYHIIYDARPNILY